MTVKLVSNQKIAETSSKGNQEKWLDNGKWYKLDQFGYEALAETFSSMLLEYSNIERETPFCFVRYNMERLLVHGRERTGCSSENFLKPGESIVTLSHLFKHHLPYYAERDQALIADRVCETILVRQKQQ